jgi:hypothetical protein
LVQKSVLLKVSDTPSLKGAPGASLPPDVDELPDVVALDVLPHAARIAAMMISAPSDRKRIENFDFMVFSF